jgi:hypothetical protein
MDLHTARPVQIDTVLADIWARRSAVLDRLDQVIDSLHRAAGDRKVRSSRTAYWGMTFREAEVKAREVAANPDAASWTRSSASSALESLDEIRAQLAALKDEEAPYAAEYARRPWNRFYHVTNNNGHIHSSTECGTCNNGMYRTQFNWLLDWAGKSETEALAGLRQAAHTMCSRCFPDAPVEWTRKPEDPNKCPGSNTAEYDEHRTGYYTGNWGRCRHCGEKVTIPGNSYRMRKHPRPATAAAAS